MADTLTARKLQVPARTAKLFKEQGAWCDQTMELADEKPLPPTPAWYLFSVESGTELEAQRILTGYGAMGRNPVEYRYLRTNKDGTKVVGAVPRLRGYYVGLWFDPPDWHTILELRHVNGSRVLRKPLSRDGLIRRLDGLTIIQIQTLLCPDYMPDIEPQRGLKPGDTVVVKGGTHNGWRGTIKRNLKGNKADRVVALMQVFGSMREVVVDAASCELIEAA